MPPVLAKFACLFDQRPSWLRHLPILLEHSIKWVKSTATSQRCFSKAKFIDMLYSKLKIVEDAYRKEEP